MEKHVRGVLAGSSYLLPTQSGTISEFAMKSPSESSSKPIWKSIGGRPNTPSTAHFVLHAQMCKLAFILSHMYASWKRHTKQACWCQCPPPADLRDWLPWVNRYPALPPAIAACAWNVVGHIGHTDILPRIRKPHDEHVVCMSAYYMAYCMAYYMAYA